MKIAVFTDSFFPGIGGTEYALYNLCLNLRELGHEIIFFAPDYHREQNFAQFTVHRVKSLKLTDTDMAVFARAEERRVFKLTKEFNPDLIYYCTASGMARLAVKAGKKFNKPVAGTIHTKFALCFYNSTRSRLITNILIKSLVNKLEKSDAVTTVSHDMKRELFNYGYKGEVSVIRNGFPLIEEIAARTRRNSPLIADCVNFIFCGRLVEMKNVQFSLKALGILKREKQFDNFKFTLVGSGNYEKQLKKIIKKEGLESNVIFTGLVTDREQLKNHYRKANLLLFPSVFDNDSLVIAEAAQQGVPTLTLKNCGSSERLTDGKNGFTSENDTRKFAEKIYEIVNDAELYNRVADSLNTIDSNTWAQTAKQYENLFKSLLK